MGKTEIMKQYERETKRKATYETFHGRRYDVDYVEWMEEQLKDKQSKAEAYDRLMSGKDKLPMKTLANILGLPVAIDSDGGPSKLSCFYRTPRIIHFSDGCEFWDCDGGSRKQLPRHLVNFTGDWKDSLTLPDGWEEK